MDEYLALKPAAGRCIRDDGQFVSCQLDAEPLGRSCRARVKVATACIDHADRSSRRLGALGDTAEVNLSLRHLQPRQGLSGLDLGLLLGLLGLGLLLGAGLGLLLGLGLQRRGGGGGDYTAVVLGEPLQGQPGGQRQPGMSGPQQAGQLLDGADAGSGDGMSRNWSTSGPPGCSTT